MVVERFPVFLSLRGGARHVWEVSLGRRSGVRGLTNDVSWQTLPPTRLQIRTAKMALGRRGRVESLIPGISKKKKKENTFNKGGSSLKLNSRLQAELLKFSSNHHPDPYHWPTLTYLGRWTVKFEPMAMMIYLSLMSLKIILRRPPSSCNQHWALETRNYKAGHT